MVDGAVVDVMVDGAVVDVAVDVTVGVAVNVRVLSRVGVEVAPLCVVFAVTSQCYDQYFFCECMTHSPLYHPYHPLPMLH